MHLFISYAKNDTRQLALALTDALNAVDGLTAWVDKTLRAGKSWELQIQGEIDKCDAMIVLYSPDINRHKLGQEESYLLTEIHYAKRIAKKRIIPVMAMPTDPPMSLALEQYIDYTIGGLTLADLVEALCDELGITANSTTPPLTFPVVERPTSPPLTKSDPVRDALERARSFTGKYNRDWTPFITTFPDLKIPDMPFCLVPVGSFEMGSDAEDDEKPVHSQTIAQPYYIAQYPVTNAQWALAVNAGVVKEPEGGTPLKWYGDSSMTDVPVVGVSLHEVRKFVDWLGCYLPTEMEWEYAARGVESWVYPWGNDWKPNFAIWKENSGGRPHSISSVPEGASWIGTRHMSGNILEWVSSEYQPYPYRADDGREDLNGEALRRIARGGSWGYVNDLIYGVRAANRLRINGEGVYAFVGFRLARSV